MDVVEVRIHGVGGSPGEKLLGMTTPDQAVVVGEGIGTVFLSRRDQRDIEGYDWGFLTSGSSLQPLWMLLLPFTLVNVAGWAHPAWDERNSKRIQAIRLLVHAAAALLTLTWVLWIGIVAVDYLGYQWLSARGRNVWGVVAGFLVTIGVCLGLWWIARTTKAKFEAVPTHTELLVKTAPPQKWGSKEDLFNLTFFSHEASMATRLNWHTRLVVATVAALAVKTVLAWGQPRLLFGDIFVMVGVLQVAVVVILGVLSWHPHGQYDGMPKPRALPAAAVVLAFVLTNGFFSGLALLAAKLVPGTLRPWGPELALVDGFVFMLAMWIGLALAWIVWFRRRGNADDVAQRTAGPSEELDGVDPGWKKRIAGMRGLAQAAHASPRLLLLLAVVVVFVLLAFTVTRIELSGPPWEWLQEPRPSPLLSAAGWLLPALVVGVVGLARRAATGHELRRTIGILWDVLTFWPRRYHPLAVRPYTERAVPEFQARVNNHLSGGNRLFVSAHSQGSVIAFAALAPLSDDKLKFVALLTYGSPITTLYGQVFPAYMGSAAVERLRLRLLGGADGWRNLWRQTDPIGGPVIGAGAAPVDVEVADPATAPASGDIPIGPAGTEALRRAWVTLAGHSYFYREQAFKDCVDDMRERLARS